MARKSSSTFFLRKTLDTDGSTYQSSNIDISSFVNTLQGDVLRINQVWFEWTSTSGSAIQTEDVGVDTSASAMAQLTTESQTSIKQLNNTSLIAKHQLYMTTDNQSGTNNLILRSEDSAMNPADFDDGFLVASDIIQLGVNCTPAPHDFDDNIKACVLIECEQVKMTAKDAQAILLSQALG